MPLILKIKVTLTKIVDLDEKFQILKTNVWIEYYWDDKNLMWNPVSLSHLQNLNGKGRANRGNKETTRINIKNTHGYEYVLGRPWKHPKA